MRSSCRISIQEPNCYCNGDGNWNKNMLQCRKCKRYFHEDCVHCLPCKMLLGDKFYVFICSLCNSGVEFLGRLELKWVDIAHLILYNLTVIRKKKYYDFNIEMMPFLLDNWSRMLLLEGTSNSNAAERRRRLLEALRYDNRFKNGSEIKKKRSLWGLRSHIPPNGLPVNPTIRKEKGSAVWEFKVPQRKSDVIFDGKKFHVETSFNEVKKSKIAVVESKKSTEKNPEVTSKTPSTSVQNGTKKNTTTKSTKRPRWSGEYTATYDLLNTLIPNLPNYQKSNHPFRGLNSNSSLRPPPSKRRKTSHEIPPKILNGDSKITPAKINSQINGFHTQKFKVVGKRLTNDKKIQFLVQWKS